MSKKNSTLRKTPYIYGLGSFGIFFVVGVVLKAMVSPGPRNPAPEMMQLAANMAFWGCIFMGTILGVWYFIREKQKHAERQELLDAINAKKESAD